MNLQRGNQTPKHLFLPTNVRVFIVNQETRRAEVLATAQAEHELISRATENFNRLLNGDRSPDATRQFADIQRLIGKQLAEHFDHEEEKVFPFLLEEKPGEETAQIVAILCQEHKAMLEEARLLNTLLRSCNLANCPNELWTAMFRFLLAIEKHAAKEAKLFT